MLRLARSLLVLAPGLLLLHSAQAQETLRVTFETQEPGITGHTCFDKPGQPADLDRNAVVVWLEDEATGAYVTALHRWGTNYVYNLEKWATASGMQVDGLTSATEKCYTGTTCGTNPVITAPARLDTTAIDISRIPDGSYRLRLELTPCEMGDEYTNSAVRYDTADATFAFVKNGSAATGGGDAFPFRNVAFTYSGRSANTPPGVDAGLDQWIAPSGAPLRAQTTLSGRATDDGGAPTLQWTQVSAIPAGGTASFTDPGSATTAVRFSHAGVYTLQLAASDGSLSSTDRLRVFVNVARLPVSDDAEVNTPGNLTVAMGNLIDPTHYGVWLYSWGPEGQNRSRAYLKFDVSSIAGPVNRATLRLPYGSQSPEVTDVHDVHLLDDADDGWSEATLTFNNQPLTNAVVSGEPVVGSYTHQVPPTTPGPWLAPPPGPWLEIDVTAAFTAPNHQNGVLSFFLRPRTVDADGCGMGFASGENLIEPELWVIEGWQEAANLPPTAVASAPALVVDDGDGVQAVALDGSGSSDSDGQIVRWSWREGSTEIASGETASAPLPLGVHDLSLLVEDNVGASDVDPVRSVVDDRFSGNASAASAQVITASTTGQVYPHLWVGDDLGSGAQGGDWFRIDLAVQADLRLAIASGDASSDLDLRLFAADGSTLVVDASAAGSSSETASQDQLAAGSYRVNVAARGGEASAGRYSLTATVAGATTLNLALNPAQAPENAGVLGDAGVVSISAAPAADLSVSLTSSSADLEVPASVVIAAGTLSTSFDLTLVDNAATDGNRSVTLTASASGVLAGSASFSVLDDDGGLPTVAFAEASLQVSEEDVAFPLDLVLSAAATDDVLVPFSVSGTATPGVDHDLVDGQLTIAAGRTTLRQLVVLTVDDLVEGDETIVVTLGTPTGAIAGVPAVLTVTLTDPAIAADAGGTPGPPSASTGEGCACRQAGATPRGSAALAILLGWVGCWVRRRVA